MSPGQFFRWKRLKILLGVLAVYTIVSVGYYHLPKSVRFGIYVRAPKIDRLLRSSGYKVMQGWDELALLGRDAAVDIETSYRSDYAYAGMPAQRLKVFSRVKMLENRGYVVGYSESMRNPLWVGYRIFDLPDLNKRSVGPRPSRFSVDRRTYTQVAHDDYTRSGYDRGHMAPNYGIATRYGRDAQLETFLMSNIIPQKPGVNRYIWKDLEMRVAKQYGRYFREVWVLTGPVFQGEIRKLESGVPVPSAYYKIIVDEHGGTLRALAFIVERRCEPYSRIKRCLVSIDDIEAMTDLDFFPDLPEDIEVQLEGRAATRLWPWIGHSLNYHLSGKTY
jgi:endonuclease G